MIIMSIYFLFFFLFIVFLYTYIWWRNHWNLLIMVSFEKNIPPGFFSDFYIPLKYWELFPNRLSKEGWKNSNCHYKECVSYAHYCLGEAGSLQAEKPPFLSKEYWKPDVFLSQLINFPGLDFHNRCPSDPASPLVTSFLFIQFIRKKEVMPAFWFSVEKISTCFWNLRNDVVYFPAYQFLLGRVE